MKVMMRAAAAADVRHLLALVQEEALELGFDDDLSVWLLGVYLLLVVLHKWDGVMERGEFG